MVSSDLLYKPLCPQDQDQGDPYILEIPAEAGTTFRFYVYVTGDTPTGGKAFPCYGSHDLAQWEALGPCLEVALVSAHWAPCVQYIPGLEFPFVMIYSRSIGVGEEAHVGHLLYRAHAKDPEGPFVDSGECLTPDVDFAIDADIYRLRDGSLKIAYALDFHDEPYGTGIVEAGISEDLRQLTSEPRVLARPKYDWQVYDAARVMPWKQIPGVDWAADKIRWSTIEGPVGGLVSPQGMSIYLYSGGCFFGFYAVGAIVDDPKLGPVDVTDGNGDFVLGGDPDHGFFAPGHNTWIKLAGGEEFLMTHARFGSPDATRQFCLVPLKWNEEGLPYVPSQGS